MQRTHLHVPRCLSGLLVVHQTDEPEEKLHSSSRIPQSSYSLALNPYNFSRVWTVCDCRLLDRRAQITLPPRQNVSWHSANTILTVCGVQQGRLGEMLRFKSAHTFNISDIYFVCHHPYAAVQINCRSLFSVHHVGIKLRGCQACDRQLVSAGPSHLPSQAHTL